MVFYRKYRPQTLDELDNENVRKTLTSVLSAPEPPHAFLFTGPKGLGKTSSARIVAKVLNCERLASRKEASSSKDKKLNAKRLTLNAIVEPCNHCDMCISITNGSNLDVLEIDAASNRGIDEIRDLREKIRLAPVSAQRKVYIIDEVHMLTTEAFNALLKTLEEPPEHAVFILATTEPQKVPATILSRCLHIPFHKATEEELVRSFRRIVVGERLTVDDEALVEIAKLSDGGFRDGAKVLEEMVLAAKGEKITKEMIDERYHSVSIVAYIDRLLGFLSQKELQSCLQLINQLTKDGVSMQFFIEELTDSLHKILLQKAGITQERALEKASDAFSFDDLRFLFEKLSVAHKEMRYAVLPQIPLEVAIIEWITNDGGSKGDIRGIGDHVKRGFAKEKREEEGLQSENQSGVDLPGLRKQIGEMHKKQALVATTLIKEAADEKKADGPSGNLLTSVGNGPPSPEWLLDFWRAFIVEMKTFNHTISGVLRGCRLRSFDKQSMIIETSYTFHKERLSETKTLDALEKAARVLTGNPVSIRVELRPGK